jgi:hypothetical protein
MRNLVMKLREISANRPMSLATADPKQAREVSLLYLRAVNRSLQEAGAENRELLPLTELLGAIENISRGDKSWLNSDVPKLKHRPRMDSTRAGRLGMACGVVTLFIGEGDSVEVACKYVSRRLFLSGITIKKRGDENTTNWKSLQNFREELKKHRNSSHPVARRAYDDALALAKQSSPDRNFLSPDGQVYEKLSKRDTGRRLLELLGTKNGRKSRS